MMSIRVLTIYHLMKNSWAAIANAVQIAETISVMTKVSLKVIILFCLNEILVLIFFFEKKHSIFHLKTSGFC